MSRFLKAILYGIFYGICAVLLSLNALNFILKPTTCVFYIVLFLGVFGFYFWSTYRAHCSKKHIFTIEFCLLMSSCVCILLGIFLKATVFTGIGICATMALLYVFETTTLYTRAIWYIKPLWISIVWIIVGIGVPQFIFKPANCINSISSFQLYLGQFLIILASALMRDGHDASTDLKNGFKTLSHVCSANTVFYFIILPLLVTGILIMGFKYTVLHQFIMFLLLGIWILINRPKLHQRNENIPNRLSYVKSDFLFMLLLIVMLWMN